MLVYDVFAELMVSQNSMWKPGYSTNRNDKFFGH
jgi:hypothetical protein